MKTKAYLISGLLAGVFMVPVTGLAQLEEAMGTLAPCAWTEEAIYSARSENPSQETTRTQKMAHKNERKASHLAMSGSMDDE